MASQTRATPGVYARERSSRVDSGTAELTTSFPPRCKVKTGSCGSKDMGPPCHVEVRVASRVGKGLARQRRAVRGGLPGSTQEHSWRRVGPGVGQVTVLTRSHSGGATDPTRPGPPAQHDLPLDVGDPVR